MPLQQKLLSACHASDLGGHSGFPVTYMRMKKLFAWSGMRATVKLFVQTCLVCQQAKPDRTHLPRLLHPLPVPSSAWQIISLDFVEGLPTSSSYNYIKLVIGLSNVSCIFPSPSHLFTYQLSITHPLLILLEASNPCQ